MKPISIPTLPKPLSWLKSTVPSSTAPATPPMAFDIDGILTHGGLWYGENGELVKRFNSLDGYGLRMLRESGIAVSFITGRKGPIVARRVQSFITSVVVNKQCLS